MKAVVIVAVAMVVSTATSQICGRRNEAENVNYIIGGSEATPHEFPWQVLQIASQTPMARGNAMYICGGSIINDRWVVTAAHCRVSSTLQNYRIIAGVHDISEREDEAQTFEVEKMIVHPDWDNSTLQNDIALVKISGRFNLDGDTVSPICLPPSSDDVDFPRSGHACVTSGWGQKSIHGNPSDVLRHVNVPIISNPLCTYLYGNSFRRSHICAGGRSGSAFKGDSGGPLACLHHGQYTLAGVTSFVHTRGSTLFPVVYTRVSQYRDWIDNIVATQ